MENRTMAAERLEEESRSRALHVKRIHVPVDFDFSVSAVNFMLELGRQNNLGPATGIYYNGDNTFPVQWGIVFHGGDVVFSGSDPIRVEKTDAPI